MDRDTGPALTWVVGSGGLLGQHTVAAARTRGPVWEGPAIPWGTPQAESTLRSGARDLLAEAGDSPWQVIWAAGASVTDSSPASVATEIAVLTGFLDALGEAARQRPARGTVFYASSAGGLYAGATGGPFDETTTVAPLAPYGEGKVAAEAVLADWSRTSGVSVVAGRIANLYGPGQNLHKRQGMISQLCWHDLIGRPLPVYVSLDTIRDYLYAPDAAALVLDTLAAVRAERAAAAIPLQRVKVLASGRSVTIAEVIGVLRALSRRRPPLVLATSPAARLQSRRVALRSVVYPELDRRGGTPLAVGIAATRADLARRYALQGAGRP